MPSGLRAHGWRVCVVPTLQAAVEVLSREPIDAVLLGHPFAGLDGLAVARRLRDGGVQVPLFLLAERARLEIADWRTLRIAGVDGVRRPGAPIHELILGLVPRKPRHKPRWRDAVRLDRALRDVTAGLEGLRGAAFWRRALQLVHAQLAPDHARREPLCAALMRFKRPEVMDEPGRTPREEVLVALGAWGEALAGSDAAREQARKATAERLLRIARYAAGTDGPGLLREDIVTLPLRDTGSQRHVVLIAGMAGISAARLEHAEVLGWRVQQAWERLREREALTRDRATGALRADAGRDTLAERLADAAWQERPLGLLHVRLEGLRAVSDAQTRTASDQVMAQIAATTKRALQIGGASAELIRADALALDILLPGVHGEQLVALTRHLHDGLSAWVRRSAEASARRAGASMPDVRVQIRRTESERGEQDVDAVLHRLRQGRPVSEQMPDRRPAAPPPVADQDEALRTVVDPTPARGLRATMSRRTRRASAPDDAPKSGGWRRNKPISSAGFDR